VDTEVDKRLDKIGTDEAKKLKGKAAIANARLAYEAYTETFGSSRWQALADAGAHPQRPLWASTSTKNPEFPDTIYVEELIAPGTVNTMPESVIYAFEDHGEVRGDTITGNYGHAKQVMADLAAIGVDFDDVVEVLEVEAVEKFEASWNELLGRRQVTEGGRGGRRDPQRRRLIDRQGPVAERRAAGDQRRARVGTLASAVRQVYDTQNWQDGSRGQSAAYRTGPQASADPGALCSGDLRSHR